MTQELKVLAAEVGLSEADVQRAIRSIAYRKVYNQRPEVRAARAKYNKRRQEKVKLALQVLKVYEQQKGGE